MKLFQRLLLVGEERLLEQLVEAQVDGGEREQPCDTSHRAHEQRRHPSLAVDTPKGVPHPCILASRGGLHRQLR